MKCNNENCPNDAVVMIIHVTQEKVYYCKDCVDKYDRIMQAMGSCKATILAIDTKEIS